MATKTSKAPGGRGVMAVVFGCGKVGDGGNPSTPDDSILWVFFKVGGDKALSLK